MGRLEGQTAIITGASTGIGRATAIRFAKEGANVVINEHTTPTKAVVDEIQRLGRECVNVKADMRSTEDVRRMVKKAYDGFGRVDVAFANAAIMSWARTEELTDEEWDFVVDCDLKGAFRLFREVIPIMKKQQYGRLLASSSIMGTAFGWAGHAHYCAAKAGLVGLVKSLAKELASDGITANALVIGTTRTPQSLSKSAHGAVGLKGYASVIPVGRVAQPEDIAACAVYLASQESGFLTGQKVVVDGGLTSGPVTSVKENLAPPAGYIQRYDKLMKSTYRPILAD